MYKLVNTESRQAFSLCLCLTIVFVLFVMPQLEKCYNQETRETFEKINKLKDKHKLDLHKCSKSCCAHTQWPVPHMDKVDDEWEGTNLMCGHGRGNGCVCVKKGGRKFLTNRLGNKDKKF